MSQIRSGKSRNPDTEEAYQFYLSTYRYTEDLRLVLSNLRVSLCFQTFYVEQPNVFLTGPHQPNCGKRVELGKRATRVGGGRPGSRPHHLPRHHLPREKRDNHDTGEKGTP